MQYINYVPSSSSAIRYIAVVLVVYAVIYRYGILVRWVLLQKTSFWSVVSGATNTVGAQSSLVPLFAELSCSVHPRLSLLHEFILDNALVSEKVGKIVNFEKRIL